MRDKFASSAAAILVGALFVAGEVVANPTGVPVPEAPPLSCSTTFFNVTLNSTASATCPTASASLCTKYDYTIAAKSSTGPNVDHTVFAVAATQDLNATNPSGSAVAAPGDGDSTTGFLAGARHEYAIRFNSANTKSVSAQIFISGPSTPRVGSVLIRSGNKILETCMLATPGIASDTFQPLFQTQQVTVAGGKCVATLVFDSSGNVVDVTTSSPGCFVGSPAGGNLFVGTEPIKNNSGPHGITFGTGTTTCYGPPRPSIPKCVCTATPCP